MRFRQRRCTIWYMPKKARLSEILRKELIRREQVESTAEISRQTGIPRPSLIRFRNRERTLRLDTAEVLAEYLGLELKQVESNDGDHID